MLDHYFSGGFSYYGRVHDDTPVSHLTMHIRVHVVLIGVRKDLRSSTVKKNPGIICFVNIIVMIIFPSSGSYMRFPSEG